MRRWGHGNLIRLVLGALLLCGSAQAQIGPRTARLIKTQPGFAPVEACSRIESHLGQLFYINVDGYQTKPAAAIWPEYIELVRGLQIGGVLPHFGSADRAEIRLAVRKLQESTALPLLVGVDYLDRFGLGYGGGALAKLHGKIPDSCLPLAGRLEGLLHRSFGLNQALGPTVERSSQYGYLDIPSEQIAQKAELLLSGLARSGVFATLKHFPYTPSSYNLHKSVEMVACDSPEALAKKVAELQRAAGAFGILSQNPNVMPAIAMSTHLFNCSVDPEDVATFSTKWVSVLREQLGFRGLLMTDALFMFGAYSDVLKDIFSRWNGDEKPKPIAALPDGDEAIYAARAILAGHDLVFLEGTAQQTRNVFDGLLYAACQSTPTGQRLRDRIEESFTRIRDWKLRQASLLRFEPWTLPADSGVLELYSKLQSGGAQAELLCSDPGLLTQLDQLTSKLIQETRSIQFDGKAAGALDALTTPVQPPPYDPVGHLDK